jgi:hypothetical protein
VVHTALPTRPFGRALGALDIFAPRVLRRHIPDEAAPGSEVEISGWIADGEGRPVLAAWLDIAGFTQPIQLNLDRADVARALPSASSGVGLGFAATVQLPSDIAPGRHAARVIGLNRDGEGVYAAAGRMIRIAEPSIGLDKIADVVPGTSAGVASLRIRDTEQSAFTLDRGAHTIRSDASLRVSGQLECAEVVTITASTADRRHYSWTVRSDVAGYFDAVLWTGELEDGLYHLRAHGTGAQGPAPAEWCAIEIAGTHHLAPLHLPRLRTRPTGEVLHYADASPRRTATPPAGFKAGHPIAVSGWGYDTVAHAPFLAVYFQVDERRPVPLSHKMPDPRGDQSPVAPYGFGGIIDTVRLEPGRHTICILGAAASGAGWYVIDERIVDLVDRRPGD